MIERSTNIKGAVRAVSKKGGKKGDEPEGRGNKRENS